MAVFRQKPLVIGHRGFPARHPDNSLAGVKAALALGADGVEVDVRPCREGVWVCHHDLRRGRRPIADWSLAQLRQAAVPTLAEIVSEVPEDRWLYVEVKPLPEERLLALVDPLARLLEPRQARVRLLSSSLRVLADLAIVLPRVDRSWVIDRLPSQLPLGLALSPKHTLVERLAAAAVPLHPWTVNRAARLRELARAGVASVTTNRPDVALEVLRA